METKIYHDGLDLKTLCPQCCLDFERDTGKKLVDEPGDIIFKRVSIQGCRIHYGKDMTAALKELQKIYLERIKG